MRLAPIIAALGFASWAIVACDDPSPSGRKAHADAQTDTQTAAPADAAEPEHTSASTLAPSNTPSKQPPEAVDADSRPTADVSKSPRPDTGPVGKDGCPPGQHNDGEGECVASGECASTFELLDGGRCGQVFAAAEPQGFPWSHRQVRMVDGRVFVIGWRLRQRRERDSRMTVGTQIALAYDPAANRWTRLAEPPAPRADAGLVSMSDGRIMMAGGLANTPDGPRTVRRVDIYDPKKDVWTRAAPLPKGRSRAVLVSLTDGRVLAVGGNRHIYRSTTTHLDSLIYDPAEDDWQNLGHSKVGYFGDRARAFALPDGGALFVGGCAPSEDGSVACPMRRFDVETGWWHKVSDEFGIGSLATRLPNGDIFIFDGVNTVGAYAPTNPATDAELSIYSLAGLTRLQSASHAFSLDETRVVLVSPRQAWVVDFSDEFFDEFEVTDSMKLPTARLRHDAKPALGLTALGKGEAFALLHAWDERLDFIADQPMSLRLAVSTEGVAGGEHLKEHSEQRTRFSQLAVNVAKRVPSVEQGLGPIETRMVLGQLDWLAAAWDAGKSPEWIAERLEFPEENSDMSAREAEEGANGLQQVVADFDADGEDDMAVRFHAGCYNEFAAKWCTWVTAYVPASGGWALLGMTGEYDAGVGRSYKLAEPIDLTGDGVAELIVQKRLQGAHQDATLMGVFSIDGASALRPVLPGALYRGNWDSGHSDAFLGAPGLEVKAARGSRPYIELTDGLGGYAGAGVLQRPTVHRWQWNPETQLIEPVPAEEGGKRGGTGDGYFDPKLRLYRFSDALYALEAKKPRRARRLLEQVISGADVEDTLADNRQVRNIKPEQRKRARAQLRQYAFFMLARLAIERGEDGRLARVKRRLKRAFPKSPMLGAIDELAADYEKGGDMSLACKRKAPKAHHAFGADWAFRYIFGDYPAVKFEPGFSRRQLCVGLKPPEQRRDRGAETRNR